jgi:hypothetical protein
VVVYYGSLKRKEGTKKVDYFYLGFELRSEVWEESVHGE